MTERQPRPSSFTVPADQPPIGIIVREDGRDVVHYFVDEDASEAQSTPASIQRALDLAGAWADLDWDEMEDALDRIRHESVPTPPIEL